MGSTIQTFLRGISPGMRRGQSICKNVMKNPPQKDIPVKESASLLISRTDLTQRGYNNLKKILSNEQVELASYDNVTKYLKNLDVGKLLRA